MPSRRPSSFWCARPPAAIAMTRTPQLLRCAVLLVHPGRTFALPPADPHCRGQHTASRAAPIPPTDRLLPEEGSGRVGNAQCRNLIGPGARLIDTDEDLHRLAIGMNA